MTRIYKILGDLSRSLLRCTRGGAGTCTFRGTDGLSTGAMIMAHVLLGILFSAGCAGPEPEAQSEYLIRVGERVITVEDFSDAFEQVKERYPFDAKVDAATLRDARIRLLCEMTEELLLLEKANQLSIRVSDTELQHAIEEVKTDYHDGAFDRMLLEHAISFRFWKERLRIRLLMEKIIARELERKMTITSEDVANYYKMHYENSGTVLTDAGTIEEINKTIVRKLRREKSEKTYKTWLKGLEAEYSVDINEDKWKELNG